MAKIKKTNAIPNAKKNRVATSPEARENQLISLAVDLAEQQLRDGTASSQVISHFLKLASTKERLEREILEKHKDLIVRVAGYSAFFNVLSKATQDDIIGRTEQTL